MGLASPHTHMYIHSEEETLVLKHTTTATNIPDSAFLHYNAANNWVLKNMSYERCVISDKLITEYYTELRENMTV